MKHMEATIKLIRPCLANSLRPEDGDTKYDAFQRDSSGSIVFSQSQFHAMLVAAQGMINSNLNVNEITFNLALGLDETKYPVTLFSRHYKVRTSPMVRKHESLPIGAEVAIRFFVPDHVSMDTLYSLFDVAGSYVGLSPYGHRLGYGRFTLENIVELVPVTEPSDTFVPGTNA